MPPFVCHSLSLSSRFVRLVYFTTLSDSPNASPTTIGIQDSKFSPKIDDFHSICPNRLEIKNRRH